MEEQIRGKYNISQVRTRRRTSKRISKISKIIFNLYKIIVNSVQIYKGKGLNQYRPQFTEAHTNNPLYQKHFLLRTELDGLLQLNTNIFFLAVARGSVQSN